VQVNVPYPVIRANPDVGARSSATAGAAVASVIANDTVDGVPATLDKVSLALVSSSHGGVTLNTGTTAVEVAQGTPDGTYTLSYRLCDRTNTANCAQANVTVTVRANAIYAGNDTARASSKNASIAIASVFANDTLNGVAASSANVALTLTSALPSGFTLDTTTGSVSVARRTASGSYSFGYRICETISPTNCAQATITVDLSGRGG
jgi:large repetitive protein